jgi:bacterioferritin-associated ferredoxin
MVVSVHHSRLLFRPHRALTWINENLLIEINADRVGDGLMRRPTAGPPHDHMLLSRHQDHEVETAFAAPQAPQTMSQVYRHLGHEPQCGRCVRTIRTMMKGGSDRRSR